MFETITGFEPVLSPYTSHRKTPTEKRRKVGREISRAERRRTIWTSCGMNATVVQNAAANPVSSMTPLGTNSLDSCGSHRLQMVEGSCVAVHG